MISDDIRAWSVLDFTRFVLAVAKYVKESPTE